MDFAVDFLSKNFQNCVWLAIIIVSCIPTLESKIAIPLGLNTDIWGANSLSPVSVFFLSFIGSILPSIILFFIARKIKDRTAGFWCSKIRNHYSAKGIKIENKDSTFKKYLSLTGFVAVPLPLTGVWTGSLIAGFSNLKFKYSILSIIIGALISSSIITIICSIFSNSIGYILIFSLLVIIVFLFIDLFISLFKNKKESE